MVNVISGEFLGKTVEEAVAEGLAALNLQQEEVEITVLEEPKKKLFSSTKAKVLIVKKKTDGERTVEFLEGLFEKLSSDAKISSLVEEEKITINLESENYHDIIGRRGEILDAIQCLAGAVANIGRDEYKRVVVDCRNYREKREETLTKLAEKLAAKAVKIGRKVKIEPMNPYERRIIHAALSENTEVKTQSEGKEPNRYVVIVPNNLKPFDKERKPYNKDKKFDKKPYNKDGKKPYDKDKKFDKKKNYNQNRNSSSGTGTGTGSYVKRDNYKKSSTVFFGTYLGNSNKKDEE